MTFIGEILAIVEKTDLSKAGLDILKQIQEMNTLESANKLSTDMSANPELRVFINAMTFMYSDAIKKGIPIEASSAVLINTYDRVLRMIIAKELQKKLIAISADDLEALSLAFSYENAMAKLNKVEKELKGFQTQYQEIAKQTPLLQFKYSLSYAADKWGSPSEKKAVESLTKKITETVSPVV